MATSQPLVPTGLPYGERKKLVEARHAAGIPDAPTTTTPRAQPGAGVPVASPAGGFMQGLRPARGNYDPLLEATPGHFPGIAGAQQAATQPSQGVPLPTPGDALGTLMYDASQSQSLLMKAVAEKLANKGG